MAKVVLFSTTTCSWCRRAKRHLANAYPKMGVVSRGEAVRKALFEHWITIEDITNLEE